LGPNSVNPSSVVHFSKMDCRVKPGNDDRAGENAR
jgi:hypothetical protein